MNIVYRELNDKCPVLYGGQSNTTGGHCFILDGYNEDGDVHVNWGWNGDQNGYFDIAGLNGFSDGQQMVEMRTATDTRYQGSVRSMICMSGKLDMSYDEKNITASLDGYLINTDIDPFSGNILKTLMEKGAKVVVISHFGRPEGKGDMKNSLSHVAPELEKALGHKVVFVDDCIGSKVEAAVKAMKGDEVLLLENLRFYNEEKKGDENLPKTWLNRQTFMFPMLFRRRTAPMLLWSLPLSCVLPQWAC